MIPTKPRGRGQYFATRSTPGRLRPFRQIGPGLFQSTDGRKYQRNTIPGSFGKPPRLGPMVCLNGRPHYSKTDTKRVKALRRAKRELLAANPELRRA